MFEEARLPLIDPSQEEEEFLEKTKKDSKESETKSNCIVLNISPENEYAIAI